MQGITFYLSATRSKTKAEVQGVPFTTNGVLHLVGEASLICTALVIMFGTDLSASIFTMLHNN